MRSYETGDYSILKDGNWKLHINRMNWDKDVLVVPDRCSDLEEFFLRTPKHCTNITPEPMNTGLEPLYDTSCQPSN